MFRRILVSLDGSPFAETALPAALGIARRSNAEIRLLAVRDSAFPALDEFGLRYPGSEAEQAARRATECYLRAVEERLESSWPKVSSVLRSGSPAEEILREGADFRADVLVMATHGRGGLTRFWLGSVASACAHRAHIPVLLIHPEGIFDRDAWDADVRRVVVPLDGTELSERALGPAIGVANLYGTRIALVRVIHELTVADPEFFPDTFADTERIVDLDRAEAMEYLERVAAPLREWGLSVSVFPVAATSTPAAVLDEAGGDMVVMATHARTGFARAFLGSVTDAVIRGAPGPVLVIPPEARPPLMHEEEARPVEALAM
jgi:nucleotide-binding universal stress UspA family protein